MAGDPRTEMGSILIPFVHDIDRAMWEGSTTIEFQSIPYKRSQWRPPADDPLQAPRMYTSQLSAQLYNKREVAILANQHAPFLIARSCATHTPTVMRQIQSLQEYLNATHQDVASRSVIQIGYIRHRHPTPPGQKQIYYTEKCLFVHTETRQDSHKADDIVSRAYKLSISPTIKHAMDHPIAGHSHSTQPTITIAAAHATPVEVAAIVSTVIPSSEIGDIYSSDVLTIAVVLSKKIDEATLDQLHRSLRQSLPASEPISVKLHATPKGVYAPSFPGGSQRSTTPVQRRASSSATASAKNPPPSTHTVNEAASHWLKAAIRAPLSATPTLIPPTATVKPPAHMDAASPAPTRAEVPATPPREDRAVDAERTTSNTNEEMSTLRSYVETEVAKLTRITEALSLGQVTINEKCDRSHQAMSKLYDQGEANRLEMRDFMDRSNLLLFTFASLTGMSTGPAQGLPWSPAPAQISDGRSNPFTQLPEARQRLSLRDTPLSHSFPSSQPAQPPSPVPDPLGSNGHMSPLNLPCPVRGTPDATPQPPQRK